ncbi:hypothetical protein B296_00034701 [Ensete ventricosum]|uniref:WRKY domain-containing protein n=1 Tax=Ensete ventricosum TaxID=4639 RepID=A0A426ZQC2_ENSVE|nr:hypothetical protein B296_00034701 [Ensete ventricosum]
MEKGKASEQPGILLAELARLQELAREMEAEHGRHSPDEFSRSLLQELLVSIEKAICMAKPTTPDINPQLADGDSPRSSGESSRSETSKLAFREQMSKKRKKLPEWTREVLVSAGAGAGPVDDGHSWRKYGQKGILGSKHPRSAAGCPATKQVQRSDEDPLLFHVTYHGAHTCLPKSPAAPASASAWLSQEQQRQEEKEPVDQQQQQQNQDLLLRFETGLSVKTEDLELGGHGRTSLSFSFASPWTTTDSGFISRASPAFLSPTSDSTYFSFSPCSLKGEGGGGIQESGDTGANSASDSPAAADMDLMLQDLDFESDFSSFFS